MGGGKNVSRFCVELTFFQGESVPKTFYIKHLKSGELSSACPKFTIHVLIRFGYLLIKIPKHVQSSWLWPLMLKSMSIIRL